MINKRLPCRKCACDVDAPIAVQSYSYPSPNNSNPVMINKTHLRATCPSCQSFIKFVGTDEFSRIELKALKKLGLIIGQTLSPIEPGLQGSLI
jgi:hypothetical protein